MAPSERIDRAQRGVLARIGAVDLLPLVPALLALLAATGRAQDTGLAPAAEVMHLQALRAERAALFFEAWADAAPERRAAAEEHLVLSAQGRGRLDAVPALDALARATRVLHGEDPEDVPARFVDSLDLRIVPGVATADVPRGEPLEVRVGRVFDAPFPSAEEGDVLELELTWIQPAASGEVHARRERFERTAFDGPFQMYVRAPVSGEGWRLQPTIHVGERAVAGAPVPLAVVEAFAERFARLAERDEAPVAFQRLHLLGALGLRFADGREPAWWLETVEADHASDGWASPGRLRLPPGGVLPGRPALVVVPPTGLAPDALFAGPPGAGWLALAEEAGIAIAVASLEEIGGAALGTTLEGIRAAVGVEEVVLVARGDAVVTLHLAVAAARPAGVAGLVLCTSLERPGPVLPAVPTLLVRPASDETPPQAEHVTVRSGAGTVFTTEPELPGLVREWFETRWPR
jgi:hypothetical protein